MRFGDEVDEGRGLLGGLGVLDGLGERLPI